MKFSLQIETGNEAFGEHWADRDYELGRILGELSEQLRGPQSERLEGVLRDVNGNRVGSWKLADEEQPSDLVKAVGALHVEWSRLEKEMGGDTRPPEGEDYNRLEAHARAVCMAAGLSDARGGEG